MFKKIELSAEFLGEKIHYMREGVFYIRKFFEDDYYDDINFNPHKKEGRHWLVEMENKLDEDQQAEYILKLYQAINIKPYDGCIFSLSEILEIKKAPSEICFKCIMEVIT